VKITVGEWKTRDGRKAIVAGENKDAVPGDMFVGWIGESSFSWFDDGSYYGSEDPSDHDLVEPWTDPVPWDWSATPPWLNCLIQGPYGQWYLCEAGVYVGNDGLLFNGSKSIPVPEEYWPKWSGDWRKSKTMRPGFNGGPK